jgi:hypothetical protein
MQCHRKAIRNQVMQCHRKAILSQVMQCHRKASSRGRISLRARTHLHHQYRSPQRLWNSRSLDDEANI